MIRRPAGKFLKHIPDSILMQLTGNNAVSIKKQRLSKLLQRTEISATTIMDNLLSQVYTSDQMKGLLTNDILQIESFSIRKSY